MSLLKSRIRNQLLFSLLLVLGCTKSPEVVYSYHDNGNVYKRIEIEKGAVNGEYKVFYKDGAIKTIANYKNDTIHGTVTNYYESGAIQSQLIYEKGAERLLIGYDQLSGNVLLYEERLGKLRHGKYFQMYDTGDTAVYANYLKDTLVYEKVVSKDGEITELWFEYKVQKVLEGDSVNLFFEILSPIESIYTGVKIGNFENGLGSELVDVIFAYGKKGTEINAKVPIEYIEKNQGNINVNIAELDSYGNIILSGSFEAPLERIENR